MNVYIVENLECLVLDLSSGNAGVDNGMVRSERGNEIIIYAVRFSSRSYSAQIKMCPMA